LLSACTDEELQQIRSLYRELDRRTEREKLWTFYPDVGPLRRELYAKHLEFFAAGIRFRERCMLAANRVGKTEGVGGYELTLHLTGRYPDWWQGRRFDRPVKAWAAGDTAKTVRDILQRKLLGPPGEHGTGLIPGDDIVSTAPWAGVPEAIESIRVRSQFGGQSQLQLKSYDQKREAFQGTEQDIILLDEEPPLAIYTECLLRTMTTQGMILATFTPLEGLSETVMHFLPDGQIQERKEGSRFLVMATWDDVPHLSAQVKQELWNAIPPYQRDARAKGVPQLGAGAIYPVPESDIVCDPFEIPEYWPRCYALDVGWNRTAALWLAVDRQSSTVYLYSEHYRGQAEPSVHAEAIRARGEWIRGVIDPAARGRSQDDGKQLLQTYRNLGLNLQEANNAVEAGIYAVWERLSGSRLKVFRTCSNWLSEYRLYRRDEKGRIVKERDHLMDCTRYGVLGLNVASVKPAGQQTLSYEVPAA
jgi:phage terminase large subunit-like protein